MMEPFVDQESRRRKRSFSRGVFLMAALCLLLLTGGVVYLIGFSSFSRITEIQVVGTDQISKDAVLETIRGAVAKNGLSRWMGINNFFLWPWGNITINYLAAETVMVQKNIFTRSIVITVQEREYFGVWCGEEGGCFWFDSLGVLFDEAPVIEGRFIVRVVDRERTTLSLGKHTIAQPLFGNFKQIVDRMKAADLPAQEIIFQEKLQEVHWKTFDGALVLFSLRFDPTINISALETFIQKLPLQDLDYVDLRVDGRLYYKPF